MKRIRLNDTVCLTDKFMSGNLTLILDDVIDSEGCDLLERDGKYFLFSNGKNVHCRFSEGDSVAVMMRYRDTGLDQKVFGDNRGWNDRRYVLPEYMPHRFVVEEVRCVRAQDLTEEEILRAGISKNLGGRYLAGGRVGGAEDTAQGMFHKLFNFLFKIPYQKNPWVIMYEVTPVLADTSSYKKAERMIRENLR